MTDFERLSITAAALRTILHQEEAVARLAEEKPSVAGAASAAQAARAAAVAALRLIGDISEASAKAQQAAIIQRARRALQLASQRTDAAASFDHLRMVN